MRYAYTAETVRAAEREPLQRLPAGTLMGRAAAALARRCADLLVGVYGAEVVLLVGSGDNGGDALYAGARLAARGARVRALLAGDRAHEAGLAALRAAGGRVSDDAGALDRADLVVDGMLGIGGRGGLRGRAVELADRAAGAPGPVVAVDLPSGVEASSGRVPGPAVHADVTVTFGALKTGLVVSPGAEHAGLVELVDIGLRPGPPDVELADADDVAGWLPRPSAESDKYRRGVLGVLAGSDAFTGAAVLAVGGAVRAGVGMVRYVGDSAAAGYVRRAWPQVVVHPGLAEAGRVQAWVVGSGQAGESADAVLAVLDRPEPVLLDAGALAVVAERRDALAGRSAPTLLTPHAGEFARLMGVDRDRVEADRLAWARRGAAELGATVLLKGSTTAIADPDGAASVNPTGTPWLATAGTGDVLAGAAGALLAGGLPARRAGAAAAFLHGLAAQLAADGGVPISATDLLAHWHRAVRAVATGRPDPPPRPARPGRPA